MLILFPPRTTSTCGRMPGGSPRVCAATIDNGRAARSARESAASGDWFAFLPAMPRVMAAGDRDAFAAAGARPVTSAVKRSPSVAIPLVAAPGALEILRFNLRGGERAVRSHLNRLLRSARLQVMERESRRRAARRAQPGAGWPSRPSLADVHRVEARDGYTRPPRGENRRLVRAVAGPRPQFRSSFVGGGESSHGTPHESASRHARLILHKPEALTETEREVSRPIRSYGERCAGRQRLERVLSVRHEHGMGTARAIPAGSAARRSPLARQNFVLVLRRYHAMDERPPIPRGTRPAAARDELDAARASHSTRWCRATRAAHHCRL